MSMWMYSIFIFVVAELLGISVVVVDGSSCGWRCRSSNRPVAMAVGIGRRDLLRTAIMGASSLVSVAHDGSSEEDPSDMTFRAYQVVPDATVALNPSLLVTSKQRLLTSATRTKRGGVLWLGEHHNSKDDHLVQEDIIRSIHKSLVGQGETPLLSIGLEQVQVRFQSVLEDYLVGKIKLEKLRELVEWDTRWQWSFDGYAPLFKTAKDLGIQLVALNVDSEDLAKVEKNGLPGLSRTELSQYIPDPNGFAEFTKPKQFSVYVDYVIRPSYDMHRAMGLLKYTISGQELDTEMPFRNFFSGRILWDEAMASRAYQWTLENPGGLMIGLVGADHVKFRDGIPGRYARFAGDSRDCTSVILNPTLIDTRPSGTVSSIPNSDSAQNPDQITLQLRYVKDGVDLSSPERFLPSSTGGVLPLADYIVIS